MSRARAHGDADRQVISAIADGDTAALASALRAGGASPRSDALKLLISAITRREVDSLHLLPTRGRGQKQDPLLAIAAAVSPLDLRRGLEPSVAAALVDLLDEGKVWIGRKRASKQGPRGDKASVPKIWRDGWAIENEITKLAEERAHEAAKSAPRGSVIPVVGYAGIQAEAIRRFIASQPMLSEEAATRYAKRALKEVRELDWGE